MLDFIQSSIFWILFGVFFWAFVTRKERVNEVYKVSPEEETWENEGGAAR